jgi:hypothetical protein
VSLPRYDFTKDRQHWIYSNARDTGWPIQGYLEIHADGNDVQLYSPETFWRAEPRHKLVITAAGKKNDAVKMYQAQVFWKTAGDAFSEKNSLRFSIAADESFATYTLDIGAHAGYQGVITGLRLDPFHTAEADEWVRIRSIEIR